MLDARGANQRIVADRSGRTAEAGFRMVFTPWRAKKVFARSRCRPALFAVSLALFLTGLTFVPTTDAAATQVPETGYQGPWYGTIQEQYKKYNETFTRVDDELWAKQIIVEEWTVTYTVTRGTLEDEMGFYDTAVVYAYALTNTGLGPDCTAWRDWTGDGSTSAGMAVAPSVESAGFEGTPVAGVGYTESIGDSCGGGTSSTNYHDGLFIPSTWQSVTVPLVIEAEVVRAVGRGEIHDDMEEGAPGTDGYERISLDVTTTVDMSCDLPCDGTTWEPPVQALFDYDWLGRDAIDTTVMFDARASGGSPTSYRWTFSDGATSVGPVVQHTFPAPGRYQITLTVSREAAADSRTRSVVVNPVATFAPEVRFTKGERFYPLDQRTFIKKSSLRWSHDAGCRDHEAAVRGTIDMHKLGHGGYRRAETTDAKCERKSKQYRSSQPTRPYANSKIKANPEKPEGFFLDLKNTARDGVKPSDNGLGERVYVSYAPEKYVTYWFMYGYDNKGGGVRDANNKLFGHEGEWERIIVHLTAGDEAFKVSYFQHNCAGEVHLLDELAGMGSVTEGTHPVIYAAKGAHASYPRAMKIGKEGSCADEQPLHKKPQGIGDNATGGGPVWQTWHKLGFIHTEPWYGFGGAWGEVVADSDPIVGFFRDISTGPLGPPHLDPGA